MINPCWVLRNQIEAQMSVLKNLSDIHKQLHEIKIEKAMKEEEVELQYTPNHVIIAVDFDGTICTVDYPEIGREREGAKEIINKLYDEGYMIIINTCRTDDGVYPAATMAKKFMEVRGIKYHHFNENAPHILELYGCDTRKISADIYLEDKALFEIPTWDRKYLLIKNKYPNPFDKTERS